MLKTKDGLSQSLCNMPDNSLNNNQALAEDSQNHSMQFEAVTETIGRRNSYSDQV